MLYTPISMKVYHFFARPRLYALKQNPKCTKLKLELHRHINTLLQRQKSSGLLGIV
jgi:predicted secreted Zn-dependent protease